MLRLRLGAEGCKFRERGRTWEEQQKHGGVWRGWLQWWALGSKLVGEGSRRKRKRGGTAGGSGSGGCESWGIREASACRGVTGE